MRIKEPEPRRVLTRRALLAGVGIIAGGVAAGGMKGILLSRRTNPEPLDLESPPGLPFIINGEFPEDALLDSLTPQEDYEPVIDATDDRICVKVKAGQGIGSVCGTADGPFMMTGKGGPDDPHYFVVVDGQKGIGSMELQYESGSRIALPGQKDGLFAFVRVDNLPDTITAKDKEGAVVFETHPKANEEGRQRALKRSIEEYPEDHQSS